MEPFDPHAVDSLAPTLSSSSKRKWIYPERRGGMHAQRRQRVAIVLMGVYLLVPWLEINKLPLLRIDVLAKRIYFFGQMLRFNESAYLAFLLIILAMALFFVTSLKGRLWCGYACPQTVFIEWLIRPIEEFVEGKAFQRKKLDAEGWSLNKILKKMTKHGLFLLISTVIANALLAYFVEPSLLIKWMSSSPSEHPYGFGVMAVVMGVLYFDFFWFREQFCSFLCPYARFQSLMIDETTPVVTYDYTRGEPRGKKGKGDCIDCQLCTRVCPTGIDIRKGLQLECIQCFRCVDACHVIMTNLKRPSGLIRQASMEGIKSGHKHRGLKILSRPGFYGVILLLVSGVFAWRLFHRPLLKVQFIRPPHTVYSKLEDGRYANILKMRAVNNTNHVLSLNFEVLEPKGVEFICGSCQNPITGFSDELHNVTLLIPSNSHGSSQLELVHKETSEKFKVPLLLPD